jgi:hypothetical protein
MKYRGIFEYEYPTEHKPPISIDVHLHGDCVNGKIIEWEYRPLEQEPFINKPCVSSGVCEHDKNKMLDKIRAEIEPKCDRINSLASVLPYTAHREIQELLCEIIDLCKAESEIDNGND